MASSGGLAVMKSPNLSPSAQVEEKGGMTTRRSQASWRLGGAGGLFQARFFGSRWVLRTGKDPPGAVGPPGVDGSVFVSALLGCLSGGCRGLCHCSWGFRSLPGVLECWSCILNPLSIWASLILRRLGAFGLLQSRRETSSFLLVALWT